MQLLLKEHTCRLCRGKLQRSQPLGRGDKCLRKTKLRILTITITPTTTTIIIVNINRTNLTCINTNKGCLI